MAATASAVGQWYADGQRDDRRHLVDTAYDAIGAAAHLLLEPLPVTATARTQRPPARAPGQPPTATRQPRSPCTARRETSAKPPGLQPEHRPAAARWRPGGFPGATCCRRARPSEQTEVTGTAERVGIVNTYDPGQHRLPARGRSAPSLHPPPGRSAHPVAGRVRERFPGDLPGSQPPHGRGGVDVRRGNRRARVHHALRAPIVWGAIMEICRPRRRSPSSGSTRRRSTHWAWRRSPRSTSGSASPTGARRSSSSRRPSPRPSSSWPRRQ